jgi:hypothetical protein
MYRYVRGLVPIGVNAIMQWGTLWHAAAQRYYRALKHGKQVALERALDLIETCAVVKNENHGDTIITLDAGQRTTMADTFRFYYDVYASKDVWDEIVSVEESIHLVIRYKNEPAMRIRCTIDLLARKNGRLVVVDHKTTGDVKQNLQFLSLDLQARIYPLAVVRWLGQDVDFCYNMIARDVPPGYGHRPLETETGKKRNAATLANMQRTDQYLRREWITYSPQQYASFERTLVQNALVIEFETETGIWPRRVVKMGGMACDKCDYFAICSAELAGRELGNNSPIVQQLYTIDPLVGATPDEIARTSVPVPARLPYPNPFERIPS